MPSNYKKEFFFLAIVLSNLSRCGISIPSKEHRGDFQGDKLQIVKKLKYISV